MCSWMRAQTFRLNSETSSAIRCTGEGARRSELETQTVTVSVERWRHNPDSMVWREDLPSHAWSHAMVTTSNSNAPSFVTCRISPSPAASSTRHSQRWTDATESLYTCSTVHGIDRAGAQPDSQPSTRHGDIRPSSLIASTQSAMPGDGRILSLPIHDRGPTRVEQKVLLELLDVVVVGLIVLLEAPTLRAGRAASDEWVSADDGAWQG